MGGKYIHGFHVCDVKELQKVDLYSSPVNKLGNGNQPFPIGNTSTNNVSLPEG